MNDIESQVMQVPGMETQIGQIPQLQAQGDAAQARASGPDRVALDKVNQQIEQTDQQQSAASANRVTQLEGRQQFVDQIDANAPKDNIKHVMQQSPLFMALAALAGGGFKTSAVTGLSSMNGMVQGMVKGDREAYEDHWKEYERQIESMKMKFELQDQVYNEIKDNFANTRESQMHAWRIASAAVDMDQKEADRSWDMRKDILTMWQKAHMQFVQFKNQRDIAAGHDIAIEHNADERAGATDKKAAEKTQAKGEALDKISQHIDELITQIEKHPGSTGLVGVGKRAYQTVTGSEDTSATDIDASGKLLAAEVAQYEHAGGKPSTSFINLVESIAGANAQPLTNDKNSISRLKQLKALLDVERKSNTKYNNLKDLQDAVGAGTISREQAISIASENNWISTE